MERAPAELTAKPPADRNHLIETLDRGFSPGGIQRRRNQRLVNSQGWLLWIHAIAAVRRVADVALSLLLLMVFSLPILAAFLYARSRGGGVSASARLGRWAAPFDYYQFDFRSGLNSTPLAHLPSLVNVLKGDLSIVGPRAASPDATPSERIAWRRYQVRPGLLCLWWIRRRANIDYSTESQVDAEYVDTQSLRGDFGIALRAIPAAFYGDGHAAAPDIVPLAGISINNLTMEEAIDYIADPLRKTPAQVCFVNADCVNIAARRRDYMTLLGSGCLVVADGIGIKLAGKILNTNIRQNINGTDLFPRLCSRLEKTGQGIFLLGGRPGVAEDVAAWIGRNHPAARVCGLNHGFFGPDEEAAILRKIHESGAHLLLVAFGAPKQDLWIEKNLAAAGVKVAMGVGGLFDFYSGRIPRAPAWLRELGGEWLFRFIQEPRRMWRRYFIGNVVFLYRVFRFRARVREREWPGL